MQTPIPRGYFSTDSTGFIFGPFWGMYKHGANTDSTGPDTHWRRWVDLKTREGGGVIFSGHRAMGRRWWPLVFHFFLRAEKEALCRY